MVPTRGRNHLRGAGMGLVSLMIGRNLSQFLFVLVQQKMDHVHFLWGV